VAVDGRTEEIRSLVACCVGYSLSFIPEVLTMSVSHQPGRWCFPIFGVVLFLAAGATNATAQQPAVTVEAELVEPLDAGHAKVGQSIKARVKVDWADGTCTLKHNGMVKGQIVGLQSTSKTAKDSGIALLFDSGQCGGHDMKPLPLTIVSVIGSAPAPPSLADSPGMGIGEGSRGGGVASANAPALEGGKPIIPLTISPGAVYGLNDVKLGVGTGPQGSSVLGTSGHNVRLETGTILVLARTADLPPNPAAAPATNTAPATNGGAPPAATPH
jgi:hypothetical protein